jgi:acetolactate synthase-1/2/3 large subunit
VPAAQAADLEQATGIPVVAMESPRGLNDPALGAFAETLAEADRVLLLGKTVDFLIGFAEAPHLAPQARFLQIEPEAEQRARAQRMLADRLLLTRDAAPQQATAALIRAAKHPVGDAGWRRAVGTAIAYRPDAWAEIAAETRGTLHPVEIGQAVQAVLEAQPQAVLIVDGGEVGQWVQATTRARRRLINGPAGGIGSALPFALAARLAEPDAPVIAVMGDGTVGFHLSEFETAAREHLPFVAVIGNDRRWNAEHQIQLATYGPDRLIGCELSAARYDRACTALGGRGWRVDSRDGLARALAEALASGQPACIDAALDGQPAPKLRRTRTTAAAGVH